MVQKGRFTESRLPNWRRYAPASTGQLRLLTSWHWIGLQSGCGGESRKVGKTSIDVQRESAWLRLITTKPDISLLPSPVCCKASTAATPALLLAPLYRRSTCTPTRRASPSRRALCCSTLAFFSTACFSRPPSCPAVNASAWPQVLLCALLSAPLPDTLLALPPL